jgi:hypothetical protein
MRKWLRQRLLNLLVDGDDAEIKIYPGLNTVGGGLVKLGRQEVDCERRDGIDLPDPISFRIQQVSGGTIVETRWWDKKRSEEHTSELQSRV